MKFLFDLFPVILFFAMFKWGDAHPGAAHDLVNHYLSGFIAGGSVSATQAPVLLATAIAIIATAAQIGFLLIRRKKVDAMLWISLAVIVFFGGLTIYFNNEKFIKLKPTVLYWCFAVALLLSQLVLKKNVIRTMMEKQITLPDQVWQRLNFAWIGFFTAMGLINLFVAFVLFQDNLAAWVNFKLFGGMGLMFVFVICQSIFLSKYLENQK
ncbi:MAG: septation protein A [Burkholderiales bacterium]